jgi:vacuolar-type H+-ATPase subunit I/STV1
LMKKVTIITPPEYEGIVLESLGRARVTQLTHVTGSEFEGLEAPEEQTVDYKELYQRVQTRLVEPLGLSEMKLERVTPSVEELKDFARDPTGKVDSLIAEADSLINKIKKAQERVNVQNRDVVSELNGKLESEESELNEAKSKLLETLEKAVAERNAKHSEVLSIKAKLVYLQALQSEDYTKSIAVGVVKTDFIPPLKEYLKRYPETSSKVTSVSDEKSLVLVFGGGESKSWAESLFMIYDVKDIKEVLDAKDLKTIADDAKRTEAIDKAKAKLADMEKGGTSYEDESSEEKDLKEKIAPLDEASEKRVAALKEEAEKKTNENDTALEAELEKIQDEQKDSVSEIDYYSNVLKVYSRKNAPVLRGKVISILQGYTPENLVGGLNAAVKEVEAQIGESLFVEVSDLGEGDEHAPTPEIDFKTDKLQPLWILTRLRGWPSADEFNPGYISVLVFCFQFGLMFGDIGQGLVFLALGLALNGKYKEGMMKYLFALFIPMGIAAIVFGFAYDSIFLYEHEISHWLHEAHITLPFKYPIMPNPLHETGELMNLIFKIGAIELVFGSLIGVYNAFKAKNYAGMIGEHGFGMSFYVVGLYLSAATMFTEGLDIMLVVAGFPFKLMLLGMGLSFFEPILHSLMHGHGIGGMEAIGEGIGGLLMTFVEGLANMFSFLRIAAFAIAHVSLSGAGESLGHAINNPVGGIIIMNIIALTFEFVSSGVQSIRLLYYEFMGKFFHGEGIRFKPFTIRTQKPVVE